MAPWACLDSGTVGPHTVELWASANAAPCARQVPCCWPASARPTLWRRRSRQRSSSRTAPRPPPQPCCEARFICSFCQSVYICGRRSSNMPCVDCSLQTGAARKCTPAKRQCGVHACSGIRAMATHAVDPVTIRWNPLITCCRGAGGHARDGGAGGGGRRTATGGAGGRWRRAVWRRCAPAACQLSFSVAEHLALHKCAGAYRLVRLLIFAWTRLCFESLRI